MHISKPIRALVAPRVVSAACVLVVATAIPASALAGGELKNEWPFTRRVVGYPAQSSGEQKNELPFTATVTNGPPSTSDSGLGAIDPVLIGVVAGSLTAAGTGVLLLRRREIPRTV